MPIEIPVGPGTRVTLTFDLKLDSGDLVDGTGDNPATFTVGDGNLLPGFEKALFGLRKGAAAGFELEAEQGFGPRNPENIHILRKAEFALDLDLEVGLVVSFSDPEGQMLPGVVARVFEDTVEVDFNHPLAGRNLIFEVNILHVEQVSDEIIRM